MGWRVCGFVTTLTKMNSQRISHHLWLLRFLAFIRKRRQGDSECNGSKCCTLLLIITSTVPVEGTSLGLILERFFLLVRPRHCISTPLLEQNILEHPWPIIAMTFLEQFFLVIIKNRCDKDCQEQNILEPNSWLHFRAYSRMKYSSASSLLGHTLWLLF